MSGSAQLDHPRGKEWLTNWDPENAGDLGLPTCLADAGDHHLRSHAGVLHVVPGERAGSDPDQPRVRPQQGAALLAGSDARTGRWHATADLDVPSAGPRDAQARHRDHGACSSSRWLGWAIAIQNNETPYWVLMALAFFAGIGGGAFSGFMPSTSYFFPRRLQGTALGLQAGIGNFGVSLVQFLTPVVVGVGHHRFLAGLHRPGDRRPEGRLVPERRPRLHAAGADRRRARLDDAQERSGDCQLPAADGHLQQPGHLVDDLPLRHDLRHLRRAQCPVRSAC